MATKTVYHPAGYPVEVDADRAETLLARGYTDTAPGGEPDTEPKGEPDTELKGEALDAALREAGLPLSGTADEKRQRLADAQK